MDGAGLDQADYVRIGSGEIRARKKREEERRGEDTTEDRTITIMA